MQSIPCFYLEEPVSRFTRRKNQNEYNIWNINKYGKQTGNYEREIKRLSADDAALPFLKIYGNFMRVGIVNGQINFL